MKTPPFPGPGINGIPDIDDDGLGSGIGVGLLFDAPQDVTPHMSTGRSTSRSAIPNPYATSSASDDEVEVDLDEVQTIRRSLLKPSSSKKPLSERAQKGWLAHQSVFPPSSSSSSTDDESDKETEPDSDEEGYSGGSKSKRHTSDVEPPSYQTATDLQEPLLGPEDLESRGTTSVPIRLHVYHGHFGHWEREGLRKYKGEFDHIVVD